MTTQSSLLSYRDLLWAWTRRTIRARYQQSLLGVAWALVQPLARVAIFTFIFTQIVPVDTGDVPYVIFSYVAMVPWTLFSSAITDMVGALVGNMNLVTKIYFPREILPLAAMLARLLDALIAAGVLVLLFVVYQYPVYLPGLLYLPLILAVQLALMVGLGLFGAALNVFYRDVRYVIELGLQLWFYATPIIYPIDLVPERFQVLYFLNPMAGVIEAYRAVLLHGQAPGSYLLFSTVAALVIMVLGVLFFKRVEFQFADVV